MKSRTSFFNTTVLRKNATRFAPLWGLYTVFMLMVVFLIWANDPEPAWFATDAPSIFMAMGVINFFYAGICALLLFGDLFQSKMAGTLHAMPMRREGWFLTHLCAGLLFCLVPNAIGALVSSMILQEYCYLAFLWLGIMILQFLFFFGVGAFCMQCAGNKLGAAAVYGLFNLLAVLVAFLVDTFYAPVLYGIQTDWETICTHSPVVGFSTFRYVNVVYDNMYGIARFEGFLGEQWRYLFIAAAVGFVLLGASVLLYRSRHMESAGDFMAVKPVAPIFLVIYTLCVGAVLYFLADQLSTDAEYLFLFIGFAIGFFTGHMLLEKKVNVFQLKKWIGLGILTLAFFFTVAIAWMDPIGITRYIPKAQQIESVQLSPYGSYYYLDNRSDALTDPQDIQLALDVHSQLLQERNPDGGELCLRIRYNLKGGGVVERKYYIGAYSATIEPLKHFFSSFRYITGFDDPAALIDRSTFLDFLTHSEYLPSINLQWQTDDEVEDKYGDSEEQIVLTGKNGKWAAQGLLDALYLDCQEGNIAQNWEFHQNEESEGNIIISYETSRYETEYLEITVFTSCKHTISYLKSLTTP